ncbi:hypothetical protein [Halorientalis marina]|jgi:hypothetical protein|uniref:hypothetical protein n=1 Tax=Halorientalis marina TaxID=2931976 RepID=UPI001FF2EEA6|nr:hypothetical protein [Halorientalis marina]
MSIEEATTHGDETTYADEIRATELPPTVKTLIDEYDRLLGHRDRFLWKWIYSLFPSFRLSSVAPEHTARVRTQKTLLTMYVTVLDDVVEHDGDRETFEAAQRLRRGGHDDPAAADGPAVDSDTLAFVDRLWRQFSDGIADAPRTDDFRDVFEYDLEQTMNAIAYSAVVNENPRVANLTGARRYGAHNMVMFPYADVDLMYSPSFASADFGRVRDLLWDLQEMARIGNWLTTWEREIGEGDYTAGIVVFAVEEGIVTPAELESADDEEVVERIKAHDVEQRFRKRWQSQYRALEEREFDAETVDLDRLVDGMETVFEYHLASRGLK